MNFLGEYNKVQSKMFLIKRIYVVLLLEIYYFKLLKASDTIF